MMKRKLILIVGCLMTAMIVEAQGLLKDASIVYYNNDDKNLDLNLTSGARFGRKSANLGDLTGDGINEIAVCAYGHVDTIARDSFATGAVYILSFDRYGKASVMGVISGARGGFKGELTSFFAMDVAALGDLDGNGITELAVSEQNGNSTVGVIWVLFLERHIKRKGRSQISVKEYKRIAPDGVGGFKPSASYVGPQFANALTRIGDLDGDGIDELGVGVGRTTNQTGSVWVLFMDTSGTVKKHQEISNREGDLPDILEVGEFFGVSIDGLGDINSDGIPDIAVGAHQKDDGGNDRGAAYILFLKKSGKVLKSQKISSISGGFDGALHDKSFMSHGLGGKGDFNKDGINDLIIGAANDSTAGDTAGAIYVCLLDSNGMVDSLVKHTPKDSLLNPYFGAGDRFGTSPLVIGDINGDNVDEVLVGAMTDGEGSMCMILSPGIPVSRPDEGSTVELWRTYLLGTEFIVSGPAAGVSVYDVNGRLLLKTDKADGRLSLSQYLHLKSGLYLVALAAEQSQGYEVKKVLVP